MRKVRILFLSVLPAVLGFLYYSFQTSPGTPSFTLSQGSTPEHLKLSVSGLPTLTQASGKPAPFWRIFFSLGDGRYWSGTLSELADKKFFYDGSKATALSNAFVEYTAAYDDTVNPPGRMASVPPTVSSGLSIPAGEEMAVPMSGSEVAKLDANRELVPGHKVTFMLTRQYPSSSLDPAINYLGNGKAEFVYDDNVLNYDGIDENNHVDNALTGTIVPVTVMANPNLKRITYYYKDFQSVQSSPYNQQTVFLNFTVDPSVKKGGTYTTPELKIFNRPIPQNKPEEFVLADESSMPSQAIESSHDPNHKNAPELIGMTENHVDYRIDYQNEGAGSTNLVEIEDKLDLLLDGNAAPTIVASTKSPVGSVQISPYDPVKRSFKFTLNNHQTLHGLHEPGLGSTFTEEDTKGSLTVSFSTTGLGSWRSSAILNQAKIRFGCNPLFSTNVSATVIPCSDTIEVLKDTMFNLSSPAQIPTVVSGLPTLLSNLGLDGSGVLYRWYPSTEVNDPFSTTPTFSADAQGIYTLVASKCLNPSTATPSQTEIAYLRLNIPGPIKISVDPCASPGSLVATVIGYNGTNPSADLKWHDCSTGLSKTIPRSSDKSVYYIGVSDIRTGAGDEIFYKYVNKKVCPGGLYGWLEENTTTVSIIVVLILGILVTFILNKGKFP